DVVHGARSPHPRAVCRRPPALERASSGGTACGPVPEGLFSGGNWTVTLVPPVRRGRRAGRAPSCASSRSSTFSYTLASSRPRGGVPGPLLGGVLSFLRGFVTEVSG